MYLKQCVSKKTDRIYLQISQGYRDQNGKSRSKVVKSIGYLDELKKEYDDPIAHFKEIAKSMTAETAKEKHISLQIPTDAQIERGRGNRKNYGHIVFSRLYHELEIDRFLNNKRRHELFKFNTESMMRLLLFGRLLYPNSKKGTLDIKDKFFDKFNFSIYEIYDSLNHFDKISTELQQFLHEKVTEQYKRKTSLVYYDVTNYYFEIDKEDELRRKGPSKEKRHDPIVQMGLAIDDQHIPLTYQLFEGNTHDSQTYMPAIKMIKKNYKVERIIVVADKGLNSGDNIAFNTALGDGYIFSQKVRGASEEMINYVLDQSGYIENKQQNYKSKSRTIPAEIDVTMEQNGKKKSKKKFKIDQKQIVFYSEKYAKRSKAKRDEVIAKAADLIANPSKYKKATIYGAATYIKNLQFDAKTGEIIETQEQRSIDLDKVKGEEKLDGYYLIVTSELDTDEDEIIGIYRGLWRIEESFKITKSTLHARPIYLQTKAHINAHFLICFIALLLARLAEIRLRNKYTASKIIETLRNVECSHIDQNHYLFDYADEVTDDINDAFGLNIGKKVMSLGEIKKFLGLAKSV